MTLFSRAILFGGGCLAASALAASSAVAKPDQISVLSGSPGGSWFPMAAAIAQVFNDAGVQANAETGGGIANVVRMSRGEANLGMTHGIIPPIAQKGEDPFDEEITNVCGVAALVANYQHVIVRKDAGISTVADLEGKKFASHPIGQTSQYTFAQLLQAYGLSEDDLQLTRGSQSHAANALKDNNVVGATATTNIPTATWSEMFLTKDLKLLGISDEAYQRAKKLNPAYKLTAIPAGTYSGVDEDVPVLGTPTILIANKDQPTEDVYWMLKTLADNLDQLKQGQAALENISLDKMADFSGLPICQGAEKFYNEQGLLE